MKIGLVSPYDYSFPGGVVRHISYLANYYQKQGHKVKILAPSLIEDAKYFNEDIYRIGRPLPVPYGGTIARIPLSPWLPAQARRILSREKFDILHLHEPFLPMLCLSILMQSKYVNVGTFHAYYADAKSYNTLKPLFKKFLTRLDGKIVVSQPLYNFLNKYAPSDYNIIPNGIDIDRFSQQGNVKKEFRDGKINILFVGRLEKRKGLEYLIRACGIVNKQFPDFRLIIIGPGTRLRPGYEELAEELGLKDVVFKGFASDTELPDYYRTADIFCAPATGGESFGIVLLESMACGKPVVASNIDGYASVMHHEKEGLLVPPRNEEMLADALLSLIKDRTLREKMGAEGRMNAIKYSWSNVAQRVMEFYLSLLK